MSFGLREQDLTEIIAAIAIYPEIEKACIFGSRAKGTFKSGSDVDVAIFGSGITFDTLSSLHSALEDCSSMPYLFDILAYQNITENALREHIDRVGRVIYEKRT